MHAGGIASMTFNNFHQNSSPSFGSRGKASHLRNISVPGPNNNLATPSGDDRQVTPRSARSALLAGLRTQPKTPNTATHSVPNYNGQEPNGYATQNQHYTGFTHQNVNLQPQQRLPTPPTIASPTIHVSDGETEEYEIDQYSQQIMAQNLYLAQVQQQMVAAQKVHQLQQQLAQLQMQSGIGYSATPPMSPGMGLNGMNALNAMNIYNPSMFYYQQVQQAQQIQQQQQQQQQQQKQQQYQQQKQQQQQRDLSFANYLTQQNQLQFQQQMTTQVEISPPTPQLEQAPISGLSAHRQNSRSRSPPKLNLQPANSSSNGQSLPFRRGHKKSSSLSTCTNVNGVDIADAPKTSLPKLSGLPSTPVTATFAPGHASGTHPIRQPRGPPAIELLKEKPTSKCEGSLNFAVRQRRRAISKLVTAGIERRTARSANGSVGGTMTPVSENEGFAFEETESVGSGATGRQSRQSLRDVECNNSSADEGTSSSRLSLRTSGGLRAPSLVLSAAEKRKSALF